LKECTKAINKEADPDGRKDGTERNALNAEWLCFNILWRIRRFGAGGYQYFKSEGGAGRGPAEECQAESTMRVVDKELGWQRGSQDTEKIDSLNV